MLHIVNVYILKYNADLFLLIKQGKLITKYVQYSFQYIYYRYNLLNEL